MVYGRRSQRHIEPAIGLNFLSELQFDSNHCHQMRNGSPQSDATSRSMFKIGTAGFELLFPPLP